MSYLLSVLAVTDVAPQASLEDARMRCIKCGHAWLGQMPQAVVPAVWLAWVKALECPN